MANPVQFANSRPTVAPNKGRRNSEALKSGKFYIGSNMTEYGTTNRTGFYAGVDPPTQGATAYTFKISQGPSIKTFVDSDPRFKKWIEGVLGQSFSTLADAIAAVAIDDNIAVLSRNIDKFVGDRVQFYYDSSCLASYPRTGTNLYDLGRLQSNGTGTFGFDATPSTSASGSLTFNGTTESIRTGTSTNSYFDGTDGSYTFSFWILDRDSPSLSRIMDKSSSDTGLTHNGISIITKDVTTGVSRPGVIIDGTEYDFAGISYNHNTWVKIDAVITSNDITCYVNGTGRTVSNSTQLSRIVSTRDVNFASTPRGTLLFDGKMGLMSMVQEELSSNDILRNFNSQKARFGYS